MKAWSLAAAAAVLLLAGSVHAQVDGPCLQTVVGCAECSETDATQCLTCKAGFFENADYVNNKCDCLDGLELVGNECQPIPPPTIVYGPVEADPYPYNPAIECAYPCRRIHDKLTYMRNMRARCLRRFPGCDLCDESLKRCKECKPAFKLQYGKCHLRRKGNHKQHRKCRKGFRMVRGRCLRVHKRH